MLAHEILVVTARPADLSSEVVRALEAPLDAHERESQARFRFDADRRAYLLAHGLRRAMLARAMGIPAGGLRFSEDARGQPLAEGAEAAGLFFSHSHSRCGVAVAVTRSGPVGVDVEVHDTAHADPALLEPFVAAMPDREQAFIRSWTVLEAFWKAMGTGLLDGLPRICIEGDARAALTVRFEAGANAFAARAFEVGAFDDGAVAVASRSEDPELSLMHVHCKSPMDIKQLCSVDATLASWTRPRWAA
jgi:4'-phosphopantetheinyl transferase